MNYTNHILIKDSAGFFRQKARTQLSGKWEKAVIATLIYTVVVNLVPTLITDFAPLIGWVGSIYMLIIVGPIQFGYTLYLLNLFRGKEVGNELLFQGFEQFVRTFLLGLLISVFTFLWLLLLVVPGIIAMYRYSMAFYILADNPEISPLEAIRRSKDMMRGNKGKLFGLSLSYIGWLLLATVPVWIFSFVLVGSSYYTGMYFGVSNMPINLVSLVLCAAMLWVSAYMNMGFVAFYEELNPKNNLSKEDEDLLSETAGVIADYLAIDSEESKDE